MSNNYKPDSPGGIITLFLLLLNGIILREAYTSDEGLYQALIISVPLLVLSIYYSKWMKHVPPRKSQRSTVLKTFSQEDKNRGSIIIR